MATEHTTDRNQSRSDARERAEKKFGFYVHLVVFVLVNAMLITLDLTKSPDKLWFYWPLCGWGIGLAIHGLQVFVIKWSSLKEKVVEREMSRH